MTPYALPHRSDTYQTGLFGEELVCDELVRNGWRILGHRVRTRSGELDVIAVRRQTLAFCEVKSSTRRLDRPGDLAARVDARMQHRLRRAAVAWMADNPGLQQGVRSYRFDVFLVACGDDGNVSIEHLPAAF